MHAGYARYFVPAPILDDVIALAMLAGTTGALPTQIDDTALAERDDYIDIGATQKIDELTLGVDAYWRTSTNLLDEVLSPEGLTARPFNYARGRAHGAEFSATWTEGPISA